MARLRWFGYSEETRFLASDLVIDGARHGALEFSCAESSRTGLSLSLEDQTLADALANEVAEYLKRRSAAENLYQQKLLLDNIITNIPQHVFWKDRDSVYLGCNANFAKVAGVAQPSEMIGKTDYDLSWSRQESDWYRACDKQVMDEGRSLVNIDESQTRSDGKKTRVLTSKVPARSERQRGRLCAR
jgi:PAS domain-containing protein